MIWFHHFWSIQFDGDPLCPKTTVTVTGLAALVTGLDFIMRPGTTTMPMTAMRARFVRSVLIVSPRDALVRQMPESHH
jgi:hypothetical protein